MVVVRGHLGDDEAGMAGAQETVVEKDWFHLLKAKAKVEAEEEKAKVEVE